MWATARDVDVTNVQHSKATNRWGTPPTYVERARQALGGAIGLDPMSSSEFNEVVRADCFYTEADDCFSHAWKTNTLFLNPAGGTVLRAWRKLTDEYFANNVNKAIWIGFSVEQLSRLADEGYHPLDFSWLLPRKRIPFIRHDGYVGSPSHANYVIGMGMPHNIFIDAFAGLGKIGRGQFSLSDAPS